MMQVKVGNGLHPSEMVVSVKTTDGEQNLVIDRRSLLDGYVAIGYPIREHDGNYLVELPRETASGSWRVWVSRTDLREATERQYA